MVSLAGGWATDDQDFGAPDRLYGGAPDDAAHDACHGGDGTDRTGGCDSRTGIP